jgi:riboflavin synthase
MRGCARGGGGAASEIMFTGIVEETGIVRSLLRGAAGWRLEVAASVVGEGVAVGDSIAVNGCCLTVVAAEGGQLGFDVLEETLRRTNLMDLPPGGPVNLERGLRLDGRLGGHFVTGHIDGQGAIEALEPQGADLWLRVRAPAGGGRLLVPKGSVAIDGISLTVAEVEGDLLSVCLIPHTLAATNLRSRRVGDRVNLEFDLIAKHVEKLMASRTS